MMKASWKHVGLAMAVVIIIVLVVALSPRMKDNEKMLAGFWVGDPTFLEKAGLSEMYMYLSPCEKTKGKWRRQGYLLMAGTDGQILSNQSIEIIHNGLISRWKSALRRPYKIPEVVIEYDVDDVMPTRATLSLNPSEGTLALHNNEKLFAFFIRDNETSLVANAEYGNRA